MSSLQSLVKSSYSGSQKITNLGEWLIYNRGGFAYLAGLVMVPSQFMGTGEEIVRGLDRRQYQPFTIHVDSDTISGLICYPADYDHNNKSKCIVYHNPNGVIIGSYFDEYGQFNFTPSQVMNLRQCPLILYDYRGCGLSSNNVCCGSMKFKPTYKSIVEDGMAILRKTLQEYQSVEVWGSSLGGGVATIALDRVLNGSQINLQRLSLYNHDSFSTTCQVVMPNWPRVANCVGYLAGGYLDAGSAMKRLIARGLRVTILYHNQDPVIPAGSRMIEDLRGGNFKVYRSPHYGHANLSRDMVVYLTTQLNSSD